MTCGKCINELLQLSSINRIQEKLMEYHHSYFLAIGFVTALAGLLGQFFLTGLESFRVAEAATVIGALILGYRTGRCDEKACSW